MRFLLMFSLVMNLFLTGFVSDALAAKGMKKTVAVFDFQNDSGYSSKADLGKDFSTQLSDALVQSDQFVVLTRKDLDVVMAEQDLANSDRFAKSNAAQTGKLTSAQILIKGKITEFEEQKSGGGQGLTVKGFSIGANKATAHIAVIIQLVDSTTGEILESQRVEGDAKSGGLSLGYSGDFDISSSNFKKTPLGKAVQIAIDNAVHYIAGKMADIPWKGKVVLVKDDVIFLNAGENSGINRGDSFAIFKEGESLIDPDTGMNLGSDATKIADVSVVEVQEKFSKAKVLGVASGEIAKGDIVEQ